MHGKARIMTIPSVELDLSAGTYVKGIALNPTTFLALTQFQQLRVVTRDPDVLQPNSKRGSDDPDIIGERQIHELIQRALSGGKKSNVSSYQRYIEELVTGKKPGVLPPMHLWSLQHLDVIEHGTTVYAVIPNGEHLLAIDGETQLTAHHALGRAENVENDVKQAHRRLPLGAVIHHGVSTSDARQYFHDLNVLAVRPNVSLSLGMNTQDPVMGIVDDVTAASDILSKRVERQARQLARKSDKVVTLTNLRQMVITLAKGISGIQYGARPMPTDGVDMSDLRAVAKAWIPAYFAAFPLEILSRDTSLAGAGPVLATIGAIGQRLLLAPVTERAALQEELLADLHNVDWSKGERWNGIAGGYTASGVFSVKGTKEVAYGVHTALTDPQSPSYAQVRGQAVPNSTTSTPDPESGAQASTVTSSALDAQLATLSWDDDNSTNA
jgi:hypothetical protein